MTELCDLDAVALRRLIGRRAVSPVELLDSCLARIERVNPALNAITATCFERARREAEAAEHAVKAGEALGPLHGLPVGIKDLQETEGLRTTFGSKLFADHVPVRDERTVAAVRAAGAVVVGKTNVPEFGAGGNSTNPVYGATGNPFDPERTCGGSSGGSAAALATGMTPIATGSDTGGSLRLPAGFCGIVGHRPTPGLVPSERRQAGWAPISVLGPMGRTVADTALLFQAMVASDPRDPLSPPDGTPGGFFPLPEADLSDLRVAVSTDLGFAPVDSRIRETFGKAVARFRGAFGSVEEVDPPLDDADAIFDVLRALQFVAAHGKRTPEQKALLGPNIVANVEQGLAMSLSDVAEAQAAHTALYRRFLRFMDDYDLLICPTVAVPPFPHRQLTLSEIDGKPARTYFHWLALTYGLTLTAHPVISLPCGLDPTGTPFGIQLCGKRGGDRRLLALAAALEAHLAALPGLGRPLPDLEKLTR
ncbi:Asp-tRNAAsn/Glu-tRNAGln amidotransferase A subunit [Tistlia consotensis]|uniref:Asp-tRNAAsn/Glu-tRNAGln amidotransferase A subunit n=1 Tax=Tistlia consotensis USBA 355 TaxID=560819 RepID=A0A1Y6CPL4_9PROT|nr:amidase family protein [Tistlia consotensis]SMF64186.1 Asp-tRNAAsn/Glu-tRNAGln amidotransferase A subunit [Tistlia consotensis USBA 355]SNR97784.1 Asp-tRNAAsn/Glu-tRNAGln amidotransferase A subunit [Tistlia consotensis]